MTTTRVEAFALETGDVLVHGENLYVITSIVEEGEHYRVNVSDEEGQPKKILLEPFDAVRVMCDTVEV